MNRERITSRKNPLLQQLRRLLQSRSEREAAGEYIADGTKLLAEAVRWIPERLRTVVVTESVDPGELPPHVRLVEVPDDIMAQLSPNKTPQGALFTCALPPMEAPSIQPGTLILDGIQDPGNLGTILRTAEGAGVMPGIARWCSPPAAATPTAIRRCGRPWEPCFARRPGL